MPRRPGVALAAGIALIGLVLGPLTAQTATADTPSHGTGFVPDGRTVTPSAGLRALRADGVYGTTAADAPASVDLTPWAVQAGDQGSYDSCVSWAIGHTLLGWYSDRMGTATTFAPMYIYSQTHLTNSADGGGSYVRDAFNVVTGQGVDTLADYQPQGDTDFMTQPTPAQTANAAPYRTLGYTRLYASASGNVGSGAQTVIQQSLAAGRPVGLALPVYEGFYYLDADDPDFTDAQATGSIDGYHYVAVLGYDASGVEIENSWGTWWGDRGFAHLDWSFVNARTVEAESVYGFSATSLPAPPAVSPAPSPSSTPTATPSDVATTSPTPMPEPTSVPPPDPVAPPVAPAPQTSVTPVVPVPAPTIVVPSPTTTTPSAPHGLAMRAGSSRVAISWAATGATRYRVSVTGPSVSRTLFTPRTRLTVADLPDGRAFRVTVQAVSSTGALSEQTSAVVRTLTAPRIVALTGRHHELHWKTVTGAENRITGYTLIVERAGRVLVERRLGPTARSAKVVVRTARAVEATLIARTRSGDTATSRVMVR